jgi:hypothetical protein
MASDHAVDRADQALAAVPSCDLDADGRRAQAARYTTIAEAVTGVRREPERVVVEFDDRLEAALIDEVIAVERECCPWLRFTFDTAARRLAISTTDPAMVSALGAFEDAFAHARR